MNYLKDTGVGRTTPQSEPMRSDQVPNSAGGFSWPVDDWVRLDRFLILGSEDGSYYTGQRALTRENAEATLRCIKADGPRAVATIVSVSDGGRAAKNDQAIYALAMAAKLGNEPTRRLAFDALPLVARIGTHLFMFCDFIEQFGGWGRSTRRAIRAWYERDPAVVGYQLTKYRQRDGWSHRDVLRLAKPRPDRGSETDKLLAWAVGKAEGELFPEDQHVVGYEKAMKAKGPAETCRLIAEYDLSREMVKPEHLSHPAVWEAFMEAGMPQTALIRNLANMTRIGYLKPGSEATLRVAEQIVDETRLAKARVHPLAMLAALLTYKSGIGHRGSNTWDPIAEVVDALDDGFYAAFGAVEPTGRSIMLALDVSGSMSWGQIAGVPGLTPALGAAAMALVTAATEKRPPTIVAFSDELTVTDVSPKQRLDDVIDTISRIRMGGTDAALPWIKAEAEEWEIDACVTYTDDETWAGGVHPAQALNSYRRKMERPAKAVICSMVANAFSIADPEDAGQMDVVGFDTGTPQVLSDFIR